MTASKKLEWIARNGTFELGDSGTIEFAGGIHEGMEGKTFPKFLNVICSAKVASGSLSATFEFEDSSKLSTAAFIVRDVPERGAFLIAGIGAAGNAYIVRIFNGNGWEPPLFATGEWSAIRSKTPYRVEVTIIGAKLTFTVNGVQLTQIPLPSAVPASQVGLWLQSENSITVRDLMIESKPKTAFVVMQFSPPYNELFEEVIKPVCAEFEINAQRADEIYGPGVILEDIASRLVEATITIAEITPSNPNVFFEVGYAYAMKRPMILVAERGRELPFDVSGMRTLFYENSIGGKSKIQTELRRHIAAIMAQSGTWGSTKA